MQPPSDATPRASRARVEALAPWVAGAALALPVLVAYYPPMTDLPLHEGAIGLLHHLGDPRYVPAGLYRINLGEPNQLFHMAGWALTSLGLSTRWAVKLVVAAAVLALPVSAARFASHLGRSRLSALIVAPMGLGWLFSWGLITNLIGLSALLATLPGLDRLAERPGRRLALQAMGATVLLYFAHEAMLFVYAGIALGLAALRPWSWRATALRLAPALWAGVVAVAQARWQLRFMTPTVNAMPRMWRTPLTKLKEIPYIILPATEVGAQLAMLALTLLAIGLLLVLQARERAAEAKASSPRGLSGLELARAWALKHRWGGVAAVGFLAYATFPVSLNGATLVHERWFPPAFAILAVTAAPRDLSARAARLARALLLLLPVATLLAAGAGFVDSDRHHRALAALIPLVEPGSAVAALDIGPKDPERGFSLGPAGGRILAERGGRLAYAFTDSPVSPVVLRYRYQWTESLVRLGFDVWKFVPAHDFHRFRYALVRTQDPGLAWLATYALAAEAELLGQSGDWLLFRSRLEVVPLESPDARVEGPDPETLRDRVRRMIDELRKSDQPAPALPVDPPTSPDPGGPGPPPGPPITPP